MSAKLPRDGSVYAAWDYRARMLLVRAAILGVILVFVVCAAEYLVYAARAITFPFELDYGEGVVWQQALLIPGPRMYGDITQFPFFVFHYPPVYHLVVRAIAAFGIDQLATGRGVTLAATIAIAVLVGNIVMIAMREIVSSDARIVGAGLAGLMVFTYHPVQEWAISMRVDMLAISFSIAGVYLTIVAGQRTIILCAAILLFVLAVYTKQTQLSAPMAAMFVAAIVNARSALKTSAFGLLIGGAAFIILQLSTAGGFWHHVFEYNLHNRFLVEAIMPMIRGQKPDAIGVLVGVMAFAFLWWTEPIFARNFNDWLDAIRRSRRLRALVILSLWFVLASAQLVSVGKAGSADNYFIEWMCITAVPSGMVASLAWERATIRDEVVRFTGLIGLLLSLALAEHAHRPVYANQIVDDPNGIVSCVRLVKLIRDNPKPTLSEDMVLLLRAGQAVPIEPLIFRELAATGVWDQRPFLKLIKDHAFGLIILRKLVVHDELDDFFSSAVSNAIQENYRLVEDFGNYIVRRPLEP